MGEAFFTAFAWAAISMIAAIPLLKIMHLWLVDRTWSMPFALIMLLGSSCLLGLAFSLWGMGGALACALVYIGITAVSPLIGAVNDRRAIRQMQDDDLQRYQRIVQRDPHNAAAHASLADLYATRGLYEDAITEYEQAIQISPEHSLAEQYKLRKTREDLAGVRYRQLVTCAACGCQNPTSEQQCRRCRSPLRTSFLAWLIDRKNMMAILRTFLILVIAVALIGAIFASLPLPVKGCVVMASLVVGSLLLLRRLGGN